LGEDGPTHQPVEQMATMRMIPNFQTWRGCDAIESAGKLSGFFEGRNGTRRPEG